MESRTSDSWPWIAIAVVFGVGIMAIFAAFAMPFGGYYGMMGGAGWGALPKSSRNGTYEGS